MNRIEIIHDFYRAFHQKDHVAMNRHYSGDIGFHDPAFRQLYGDEVRAMWHMLCAAARDLEVTCTWAQAQDPDKVLARWEARYTFSGTGRRVHNRIDAEFTFKENRIIRHRDRFNMSRWTRMALGTPGLLMGWTPFLKNKVSAQARKNLLKFMKENPQYEIRSLTHKLG